MLPAIPFRRMWLATAWMMRNWYFKLRLKTASHSASP